MRHHAVVLVLVGLGALLASEAARSEAFELSVSGQVSLGVLHHRDGERHGTWGPVDNSVESTRLALAATRAGDELETTFQIEAEYQPRPVDAMSIPDRQRTRWRPERDNLRLLEARLAHERFGRLWVGQGAMASDDLAEEFDDLSGTFVVAEPAVELIAGRQVFRQRDGGFSDLRVEDVFTTYAGLGRAVRVRYDTPELDGFRFSLSFGQDRLVGRDDGDLADVATTYAGSTGGFDLIGIAALGWRDGRIGGGASGSVLHEATGVSLTLAGAGEEGHFGFVKVGWQRDLIAVGRTFLSLDHYRGRSGVVAGAEGRSWSATAVQAMEDHDAELFLTVRRYEARRTPVALQPATSVFAGFRVVF